MNVLTQLFSLSEKEKPIQSLLSPIAWPLCVPARSSAMAWMRVGGVRRSIAEEASGKSESGETDGKHDMNVPWD